MTTEKDIYNQLISMWDIQDGLLQSYRSIFITSESILIAISATILTSNAPYLSIMLCVLGYFVLHIWKSICNARALDVSFLQWLLLKIDRNDITVTKPIDAFKGWQDTRKFENENVQDDDDFKDMVSKSETRTKMEKTLPGVFLWIWHLIFVYSLITTIVIHKALIIKISAKVFCTS